MLLLPSLAFKKEVAVETVANKRKLENFHDFLFALESFTKKFHKTRGGN